jgi:hypothetical protein
MMGSGWFAAAGQIVGTVDAWETVYDWDGSLHPSRDAAIKAGFRQFGSDDFNIGKLSGDQLVWWGWMYEEHPAEDRAEVASALGLSAG